MTIDELLTQLNGLSAKLEPVAGEEATFDLRILLLQIQIEKQKVAQAFSPLADLNALAPVPTGQLQLLMGQVDEAIAADNKRVQFVQTVISVAKVALRAAGVPLPAGL
jgi:hypothetical protein